MAVDIASFKALFSRGQFDYGETLPEIRDADITAALNRANMTFRPSLYPSDHPEIADEALSNLAAHYLELTVNGGSQPSILQNSRSVDGISESLEIPEWMKQDEFAFYATTAYGQTYLIISKPYLDGAVYCIEGATTP